MEHRGEATCSINARHTNREPEVNRSPLVSVWSLNPALSGVETQSLRRVIRRCRIALTAINVGETLNTALLEMILPLAFQSPHILHGLLALSVRPSERSSVNLQHHQLALSELRADIEAARFGTTQMDQLHTLLASSFLMNLFTMSHCDGSWSQHIRGMVSLIRSVDQTALCAAPVGRYLVSQCAFQDISLFSAGRRCNSRKAWLSWMLPQAQNRSNQGFTALEITVGHPESLITIIAQISELADDNFSLYLNQSFSSIASPDSVSSSQSMSTWTSTNDLEKALTKWTIPNIPEELSHVQQLALTTAWETYRKSALLLLWRGCGFNSNLLEPVRADKAAEKDVLVTQIVNNVRFVMDMCKMHQLSIGNTMLWPIAVAGCECVTSLKHYRPGLLTLLGDMCALFSMDHPLRLAEVFDRLWGTETTSYVSLDQICNDMQLIIPLF